MYYTPTELAEMLQVHPRTIRRAIRAGKLPAVQVGKQWRVPEEWFREWQDEQIREGA